MTRPNLPALLRIQAEIARENAAALEEMADILEARGPEPRPPDEKPPN